jgi:hypothetical protein
LGIFILISALALCGISYYDNTFLTISCGAISILPLSPKSVVKQTTCQQKSVIRRRSNVGIPSNISELDPYIYACIIGCYLGDGGSNRGSGSKDGNLKGNVRYAITIDTYSKNYLQWLRDNVFHLFRPNGLIP